MSDNDFDPLWTAKAILPVKRVEGRWEFFYGGDVPVKEGAIGELTISSNQISDAEFLQRVTRELSVKVLDEGSSLMVALSDRSQNGSLIGEWPKPHPLEVPPGTTRWVTIKLGPPPKKRGNTQLDLASESGGLWLKVKGLSRCELTSSTIVLPKEVAVPNGFSDHSVNSLNHALTLLSQTYERHRISNTGNVYTRVFYQDGDKGWYPLNDLRLGVRAAQERNLLHDTWAHIETVLGWRPTPLPRRTRR